ncbi:MBOAT family O-acyltransferase [Chamaesiphon minutus]|uniref:Putative membrane protein involved in D-alanine export n=1 Tax=Chamaesiphon minutus (strain ATCC 27169 / PCC 6605) TaxID=1173020 RepID=K9UNY5_CHAP6|nr:MBOAT family O-acyltransferase [Chamaesiphon minutus]AFY96792.1 putative membrane protein involved in D-alanine export [Chamaesiphon minutus PCC 6605]
MLFNSIDFIFIYLPIALCGFWLASIFQNRSIVIGWLVLISLIFYSIWSYQFLLLLLFSVAINWAIGIALSHQRRNLPDGAKMNAAVKLLLILGIIFDLSFLGYFKYVNFFIDTVNTFGFRLELLDGLVLPLGISFYTFEQMSYLVGIAKGEVKSYSLPRFLLFVTFFPHLIAGPILNANELNYQLQKFNYRLDYRNLAVGFTIFAFGLFKKTAIADSVAVFATPIFIAAERGESISFLLAWQAAIAYTLQLYFDFSGYSDMAIGLSNMFNIKLPMNFFSPYQAVGIGDFWRRWHISLGRFLRDYLYIPLGGSRNGELRTYINLSLTMLLGGLWHGASWTFIVWGGLHGIYLCIDRGWQKFLKHRGLVFESGYHYWLARMLTFLAVIVSWVIFRAETLNGASHMLMGLFGGNGLMLPEMFADRFSMLRGIGIEFGTLNYHSGIQGSLLLLLILSVALFLPNLYQFTMREPAALDIYKNLNGQQPAWYAWQPTFGYALLTFGIFVISLGFCNQASEFLYFQF